MKFLCCVAIFTLSFCYTATAQKVYSVNYQNQADVKVFVVKYETKPI